MSKKEDLFGKLNIKDYNNQLEEVLETKNFSSDTKNFLLSILYKIEIAYNDYYRVKSLKQTKGEFIEEIIETLKNNCESIDLIKPSDERYNKFIEKKEKCIVNKEKKSIISLYNEQIFLFAILKLRDTHYKFKDAIVGNPLKELFEYGRNINAKEVIRDFDGWSWHIETKLVESIECNLVFQNILMLFGDKLKTEEQLKEKLQQIYVKDKAKIVYILICRIALLMYLNNHKKETNNYKEKKLEFQKKLEEMEDKTKYLKNITSKRKEVETRIRTIDKCLTDVKFLKREYIKTNKELEEDKKIFSISDFVDQIQNEKNNLLIKLKEYNSKMLPKSYLKEKEEIKENLKILEVLDSKKDIYYYLLELQKRFIEGIQEKILKAQTRSDIMEIIYKIRYYLFLPYKDKQIRDVEEIKEGIYKTQEIIYNVACKMNVLNQISINSKVNNEVVGTILDTNIIELENIELQFKAENYQIILTIFDEENIEKTIEYDTIEGLTARMNKKIRLFNK